jgi:hypothetical protein
MTDTVGVRLVVLTTEGMELCSASDCMIKGSETTPCVGAAVNGIAVGGIVEPVTWHPLRASQSTNISMVIFFICGMYFKAVTIV